MEQAIPINSQDILNAIDLGKINLTDKKKRGRPKKSQQLINPTTNKIKVNDAIFEQEEIILHLPGLSSSDINSMPNNENNNKITKYYNSDDNDSENDDQEDGVQEDGDDNGIEGDNDINLKEKSKVKNDTKKNIKKETKKEEKMDDVWNDINHKQYALIIKKLKEENDKLKKYLIDITPMYFTEVKIYPSELKIFDMEGNEYIPKKTNICCWWCTYDFDWLPVGIPEKYHNGIFYVFGCFCSFNCKAAYNLGMNDNRVWERYSLMKQMYYIINKNSITSISDIEINPAGPKELLEKYGGPMTIEEYRKNSKILGREYHKLMPPFLPINIGFEETTNSKTNSKTMNINNLLNPNSKDNIVVKRNKPLSNVASKEIDDFIE
jgi:hypothetical protein